MSQATLIIGRGTLGTILESHLAAPAIDLRCPDPRDTAVVREAASASVVINVAGPRVRPGLDWTDYFREHVGVTTRIARSMSKGSHLIHMSSSAVFGGRRGTVLGNEDTPAPTLFPSAAYACAKLAAELAAQSIADERGIALTILRPSLIYGPGVDSPLESIQKLARRGIALHLLPGRARQHFVHVQLLLDVVRACIRTPATTKRTLLVADPFLLHNEDFVPAVRARHVRVPIAVELVDRARTLPSIARLPKIGDVLTSLSVFGLNDEYAWRPTFQTLGLDPRRYSRAETFDAYWGDARRMAA